MRPVSEGVLVEIDLLSAYLSGDDSTVLHLALRSVPCYTTVIQAAEIVAAATDAPSLHAAHALLDRVRVLGLSPKYAVTIARVMKEAHGLTPRDAIVAGTAIDARLPVLTRTYEARYRAVVGLRLATREEIASLPQRAETSGANTSLEV